MSDTPIYDSVVHDQGWDPMIEPWIDDHEDH